jgi:hypothetical protein
MVRAIVLVIAVVSLYIAMQPVISQLQTVAASLQ